MRVGAVACSRALPSTSELVAQAAAGRSLFLSDSSATIRAALWVVWKSEANVLNLVYSAVHELLVAYRSCRQLPDARYGLVHILSYIQAGLILCLIYLFASVECLKRFWSLFERRRSVWAAPGCPCENIANDFADVLPCH